MQHTYDQLNDSYKQCISVIANLVEIKDGKFSGHGRNVANVAEAIGKKLKLDDNALFDLQSAALLHDIGKLGFTDELYNTPYISMSDDLRVEYQSHVCIAQAALLSISALDETGRIIRSHGEDFNGKGFPDKLEGEDIPLASRILAIASDFNALQTGQLTGDQHLPGQAIAYINSKAGTRYDPALVRVFEKVAASNAVKTAAPEEIKLNYQELAAGMVLARDIKTDNGLLMLSEGQLLYESLIERIHLFIDDTQSSKVVYVTGKSFEASSKT